MLLFLVNVGSENERSNTCARSTLIWRKCFVGCLENTRNGPWICHDFFFQHTSSSLVLLPPFSYGNWLANDHINGCVDVQLMFPANSLLHLFSVLFIGCPFRIGLYKFGACNLKRNLTIRFSSRMNHALTKRKLFFRVWSTKDGVTELSIFATNLIMDFPHTFFRCPSGHQHVLGPLRGGNNHTG